MTTLASFNGSNSGPRTPESRLLVGADGNLYGTSYRGGAYNGGGTSDSSYGTVFRIIVPVILNATQTGSELVLSWRTNASGFKLQSAQELSPSPTWTDFTNPPAVLGAEFVVTNISSLGSQFYRLKK